MKLLLSVLLLQATSAFASTLIVLAKEAPNAASWALSPLPQELPAEIRQNILLLREDLVDEGKTQPKTSLDAYRAGYQVCNSLIAALDERDAAKTRAGMSQTQVIASGTARNEARRNYMMSWPQYQADAAREERANENLQDAKDTLSARQNATWLKRAAELRASLENTYATYRDALRKDPAFVQAIATASTITAPAQGAASQAPGNMKAKPVSASSLKALKAGEVLGVALAADSQVPFIWCPPGEFLMGSPKSESGRKDGVEDQVSVKLSKGFWISAYEWQQKDWQAIEGSNPSETKGETMPVTNVGWNDAIEHCAKLNALGILPSGYKFTLPTEAQWEYACRAGTNSALYNGKDLSGLTTCTNLDSIAWYRLNSGEKLHPVGGKKPNKWGAFDMLGNVWEWCLDSYADKLPGGSDPVNLEDGQGKVTRGGAWWAHSVRSRSADRGSSDADYRFKAVGFRVCIIQE